MFQLFQVKHFQVGEVFTQIQKKQIHIWSERTDNVCPNKWARMKGREKKNRMWRTNILGRQMKNS